jgi:hypothetical protein
MHGNPRPPATCTASAAVLHVHESQACKRELREWGHKRLHSEKRVWPRRRTLVERSQFAR